MCILPCPKYRPTLYVVSFIAVQKIYSRRHAWHGPCQEGRVADLGGTGWSKSLRFNAPADFEAEQFLTKKRPAVMRFPMHEPCTSSVASYSIQLHRTLS